MNTSQLATQQEEEQDNNVPTHGNNVPTHSYNLREHLPSKSSEYHWQ